MKNNNEKYNAQNNYSSLDEFIFEYKRDVPNFYDENESMIYDIPVDGGTIRVYHHKPQNITAKRPIVFLPGFATTPEIWSIFHKTHHGNTEYYHIETREKNSAHIERKRKTDLSINRFALDVAKVINFFGLDNNDYVLFGTCLCGGVVLHGLINKILNPPTTIVFDPFVKWTQSRFLIKFIMPILPPFMLGLIKYLLAKILISKMKNEVQKERDMAVVDSAIPWVWRKFSIQNLKHDLTNDLNKITNEVYVFHGPKDKYHPDEVFQNIAKEIPKGHYFQMITSDDLRELLAGVIATEYSKITKNNDIPKTLEPYEVVLKRG
ncbi:MAG TPA: alpha/beta hydrolase [Candidatus Bathyarchaeia archaeon]|nr:alpha/beta hydrolase [Candidatus Bathyarchaeia archaeon]